MEESRDLVGVCDGRDDAELASLRGVVCEYMPNCVIKRHGGIGLALYREALAIDGRTPLSERTSSVFPLAGASAAALALGDRPTARSYADRAVEIATATDNPRSRAQAHEALAGVLLTSRTKKDRARGRELAELALTEYTAAGMGESVEAARVRALVD